MNSFDNQLFWSNLEKIKNTLLLNDVEFSAFIGMKSEEYLSLKNKNATLPIDALFPLAEKLNFHLTDLMCSKDFTLNYNPHADQPLLDRYTLAPHSQTRAIINILNYVELTLGTRAKINLIRKFQLSEDYIKNENNSANVLLISDILKYLSINHNFGKMDFIGIGRRMPFIENNNVLRNKLSAHKSAWEILECFVYECTTLFDTNCTYTISEGSVDYAIINVAPNKNVVDELQLNTHNFGNEELCLTKMGNFSATVFYKYGVNAQVKKINSIHAGYKSNQYLLDFSPFKKMDQYTAVSRGPRILQLIQ